MNNHVYCSRACWTSPFSKVLILAGDHHFAMKTTTIRQWRWPTRQQWPHPSWPRHQTRRRDDGNYRNDKIDGNDGIDENNKDGSDEGKGGGWAVMPICQKSMLLFFWDMLHLLTTINASLCHAIHAFQRPTTTMMQWRWRRVCVTFPYRSPSHDDPPAGFVQVVLSVPIYIHPSR